MKNFIKLYFFRDFYLKETVWNVVYCETIFQTMHTKELLIQDIDDDETAIMRLYKTHRPNKYQFEQNQYMMRLCLSMKHRDKVLTIQNKTLYTEIHTQTQKTTNG